MKKITLFILAALLHLTSFSLYAVTPLEFRTELISLHMQLTDGKNYRRDIRQGIYEGSRAANMRYTETYFYDPSGLIVSHIQSDAEDPGKIHIIEVNIIENGKVIRDFGSISLPWSPELPIRSMINLHLYNHQLHSFRQYNLYGEIDFEYCDGTYAGIPVSISIDGSDINPENTSSEIYKACFRNMSTNWKNYSKPN